MVSTVILIIVYCVCVTIYHVIHAGPTPEERVLMEQAARTERVRNKIYRS